MDTLIYLLKTSTLLIIFYGVYHFLLKRDTLHQYKRWYLLSGLLLSAVLPWMYYTKTVVLPEPDTSEAIHFDQNITAFSQPANLNPQVKEIVMPSWEEVLLFIYAIVALILLVRLIYQFFKLYQLLRSTDGQKTDSCILHIVEDDVNPFSFFNHVFVSRNDYESQNFNMIMAHEKVHITQYHSVDNVLANIFCILFWFNPMVWIYKKEMVQNLEHIADNISVQVVSDKMKYQYLLLNHTLQENHFQSLQTTFFQSSIKQRIMMLNKSTTANIYALKSIVVLPILVFLFINFQSKIVAQEKENPIELNARLSSVKYSDSTGSITTMYGNALKSGNGNFTKNSGNLKDSLKGDDRIVVKINRYASREYLDMTKRYLKKTYNIDINYSDLEYNDKKELISIQAKADCNDGFSGLIARKNSQPIEEFYIYRDFSNKVKVPFGLGNNLPLSFTSEEESNQLTYSTSVMLSPSVEGFSKTNFEHLRENTRATTNILNQVNLKDVKTFIINGKTYKLSEIEPKFMIVDDYQFIDSETFEAKGKFVDADDYFDYLKSQSKDKNEVFVENLDVIMFSDTKANFLHLKEVKVTQEKSKK